MNKKEFLADLEKRLKYVSEEDRTDAIEYYSEYLCDMNVSDEEDVCEKIGKPKEIAANILTECTEKMIAEKKESKKGNAGKIILLIFVIIFSIPVLIPLAIVIITVLFTILTIALSFIVAGIGSAVGVLFAKGIVQKMVCLGATFILWALAVLLLVGVYELGRLSILLIIKLSKKSGKKENNNEENN